MGEPGTGTTNVSINVPRDERTVLGLACARKGARSLGDYLRFLILLGLERDDPYHAEQLKKVRRAYYGASLLGLFVCGLTAQVCFGGDRVEDLRRPPGVVRVVTVRRMEDAV